METNKEVVTNSFLKKVVRETTSILSIIITGLILAMITVGILGSRNIRIMGYSGFFIETFSMDSVYPAGSLIITKANDGNSYRIGDDISFYDTEKMGAVVTHRIVDIEYDEQGTFYVTKGVDNLNVDQNSVFYKNVVGKVIYSVPEVGIYIDYIKQNFIVVIGLGTGAYILFRQVKSIVNDKKNGDKNDETDLEEAT